MKFCDHITTGNYGITNAIQLFRVKILQIIGKIVAVESGISL